MREQARPEQRERESRGRNLRRAYVERRGLAKHTERGVCFSYANSELDRITSLLDCIFWVFLQILASSIYLQSLLELLLGVGFCIASFVETLPFLYFNCISLPLA
jgi:hypothetical protein